MPVSIRQRLDQLSVDEFNLLTYAFEQNIGQHIELPNGKFVGVNVEHVKHLMITESAGAWSYGEVKG